MTGPNVAKTTPEPLVTLGSYPLAEKQPEVVLTPAGHRLADITVEAIRNGTIGQSDLRITPETLDRQADIAEAAGRATLGRNLRRAAELTSIPDDVVLAIYTALRPHRSTASDLEAIAARLEHEYHAPANAALVRDAAAAYLVRGLLKSE